MTNFVCKTSTCKFLKAGTNANLPPEKKVPYRESSDKKQLQCRHCNRAMAEDANAPEQPARLQPAPDNFGTANQAVNEAKQLDSRVLYIKGVQASLLKADTYFRDEFVKDMRNPAYVKEFVFGARQSTSGVVCVDSAHKVCGLTLPAGAPKGSKFDWEMVYLAQHAKWPIVGKVMQDTFASFVATIADNAQYIVSTMPDGTDSSIGHTVVLTQLNGVLWMSDAQKLNIRYGQHKYVAWKRPDKTPRTDNLYPKCQVDRRTGDFVGDWISKG